MKKTLFVSIILILISLVLGHGSTTLSRVEKNMYAAHLKYCDPGSVKVETSTFLGLTSEVTISGKNCAEPDGGWQEYTAQIWDHGFWIMR